MDFKTKTSDELRRLVFEQRAKLQAFRFAMAGGKTKNVKEGKAARKDTARILTELRRQQSA